MFCTALSCAACTRCCAGLACSLQAASEESTAAGRVAGGACLCLDAHGTATLRGGVVCCACARVPQERVAYVRVRSRECKTRGGRNRRVTWSEQGYPQGVYPGASTT